MARPRNGRNPFERPSIPAGESVRVEEVSPRWERIRQAQKLGEAQRRLTEEKIHERRTAPPAVVHETQAYQHPKPVLQREPLPPMHPPTQAHRYWVYLCLFLWLGLTVASMTASLVGGFIIGCVLFWVCGFFINFPSVTSGLLESTNRKTKGGAV